MAVLKLLMLRDSLIFWGSPFHSLGPETEKARSPMDLVFNSFGLKFVKTLRG